MDLREHAAADCSICSGKGRLKTGPGRSQWAVCPCAIGGQQREVAKRVIKSSFSARAQRMTFETFQAGDFPQNERALLVARNFVDNWPRAQEHGWVFGFYGQPRSGKTHLGVAIAQACIRSFNIRPLLLNLPKALREERERYSDPTLPSPMKQAQTADLLILDDLGAEYERQGDDPSRVSWITEQLYAVLDERFMNNRPLIFTTNLSPSDMERRYKNEAWRRVYSRLEAAQVAPPLEVFRVPDLEIADPEAKKLLFAKA